MSTAMEHSSNSGSELRWALIDEIRAQMARRHVNQLALAADLKVSQPWLNRRLMGHTDITVTEGEAIAAALGTTFAELVRRADGLARLRRGESMVTERDSRATRGYPPMDSTVTALVPRVTGQLVLFRPRLALTG
jgi:transcriptional regulator with XRE-family HTH domain